MKVTFRIWVWIIFVILAAISLFSLPPIFFEDGVMVDSVVRNSTLFESGLREGMTIKQINGAPIASLDDYASAMQPYKDLLGNQT